MKHQKNLWIYSCIVIAGLFVYFLYHYLGTRYYGLQFPRNNFLFLRQDQFMDFFNVNSMASGLDPYIQDSSYPPLAMIIAYIFSRIIPGTETVAALVQRDSSEIGRICLFSIYAVCFLVLFIAIWKRILIQFKIDEKSAPLTKTVSVFYRIVSVLSKVALLLVVAMSIIVSAPMIFAFDRGNYLILCVLFLTLFCLYYEKNDYVAATFLAIAACLKIFPVVLFLVFFFAHKWKPLAFGILFGGSVTVGCTIFLNGNLFNNLFKFVKNVLFFTSGRGPNDYYYYYYSVGTRNLIATISIALRGHISDRLHIEKLSLLVNIILFVVIIVMCIIDNRPWRQILYLSFFIILFQNPSYYYGLAYLTGPIFLFLLKNKSERMDWIYLIGLALIMIPKSYYYFLGHFTNGDVWIGLDSLLDPLILYILLFLSFLELIFNRRKRSVHTPFGHKKGLVRI